MGIWRQLASLTSSQRNAVVASFLGWTLDAFDFFILVMVADNIADDFGTKVSDVIFANTLTLFMRPVGAFLFGYLADRFGRRPTLMLDIMLFSVLELSCAFAPNLQTLLVLRLLFGIAMGGEWGVGSSLVMESIPPATRGAISGLLQEGYAFGYLLAAVAFYFVYTYLPNYGWRAMFVIGTLPALLVVYIRSGVEESPGWEAQPHGTAGMFKSLAEHWRLALYIIVVMSCFNAFSHGTQDNYKVFLSKQHHLDPGAISTLTIIGNLGAIVGGLTFGTLSEYFGRRRTIIFAALLALPIIPLWAYASSLAMLALGAFLIQIAVQGAWGIVPVHLNELSPPEVRGSFPGFTYQLGNAIVSSLGFYQAKIAEAHGNDFSFSLSVTTACVAVILSIVIWFGGERKGVALVSRSSG